MKKNCIMLGVLLLLSGCAWAKANIITVKESSSTDRPSLYNTQQMMFEYQHRDLERSVLHVWLERYEYGQKVAVVQEFEQETDQEKENGVLVFSLQQLA